MHRQTAADAELILPAAVQASLLLQTYQNSTCIFRTIEKGWQRFYRDPPHPPPRQFSISVDESAREWESKRELGPKILVGI